MDIKQRAKEWLKEPTPDNGTYTQVDEVEVADIITDLLTALESAELAAQPLYSRRQLEAERDRYREALERIYDDGAEGCCKYCDIKADIAKEALAGGDE